MVFSSLTFLYLFLPGTILLYYILPAKARNLILLVLSLVFYFAGEQLWLLLMLGEITAAYFSGLLLEQTDGKKKKAVFVLFLLFSFGMLGVFKYADLITETAGSLTRQGSLKALKLHLPVGISFYIFQAVSYVTDVYRKKYPAEKNLLHLALYVSFFPQLIAGPIVRFESVSDAIRSRKESWELFGEGAFRFVTGLGKKVLLADRLYAFCQAANGAAAPSVILSWAEGLAFLLFVYFDFSGYSDMAIGLGNCFGFRLPENFRYPLVSRSIGEFWRRWHITLGSWFRDYLYIPLGGSRCSKAKHVRNILIVWALTGLWHGASWNFVIWGLCFGLLMIPGAMIRRKRPRSETIIRADVLDKAPEQTEKPRRSRLLLDVLRCAAVMILTVLIFVWFRFTGFQDAVLQFSEMFGSVPFLSGESFYYLKGAAVLLTVSLIGATYLPCRLVRKLEQTRAGQTLLPFGRALWMLLILAVSTAYLADGSFSPFLYFRF